MGRARCYGWIRDCEDSRDKKVRFTDAHVKYFSDKLNFKEKLVSSDSGVFDLRSLVKLPECLDNINQYSLGSCTANSIAFAYAFDELKQGNKEVFMPSRLFIYYNERLMEGTIHTDSGAQIRDGIKSLNKYGVCDEHHWIYDPSKFADEPPKEIYDEAKLAKAIQYAAIDFSQDKTNDDRVVQMKKSLQSGFPFVFGFEVYQSFESPEVAKTGMMPMPKEGEKILGGHAVCAVGFDDTKKCFIVKNSWGANWGDHSYFYMPYEFISDPKMASDFWVIQQITNPDNIPNFDPKDITPDAKDTQPASSYSSYCIIV